METLFLILVFLLLGLAIFDLVVGVSNDAVNFLTSAIGSKAGSFKLVMIVASVGIFIGAASAGGMMEIARKGVFFPDHFTFQDVIFIYVVVMFSDILLLDVFNSLKLPTSTTISIVFELLGASLAFTIIKMNHDHVPINQWVDYINSSKASSMIVAIFVSVAIAFIVGWLLQFILRALVSFKYQRYSTVAGSIFGGISTIVVVNFIINVAFKSSPLRDTGVVSWMIEKFPLVALITFVISGLVFFLIAKGGKDPFRIITLMGTFALAMAFASNDLVNFIGVPVASYDAYVLWKESGVAADEFMMTPFMDDGLPANQLFLIVAGVVMALTLWLSKKARNVIQTTVNLSRQKDGVERFKGNGLVRAVVKGISSFAMTFVRFVPDLVVRRIDGRFSQEGVLNSNDEDPPAFDTVRASSNLIVAALLISVGTTMKLPLSTTYVSFMVLMGTSLADRAWNRDSAVYRVAGVFTIIGGWFMTAIAALVISGLFTFIVYNLHFVGIGIVLGLVVLAIIVINKLSDNNVELPFQAELPSEWFSKDYDQIHPAVVARQNKLTQTVMNYFESIYAGIKNEDTKVFKERIRRFQKLEKDSRNHRAEINELLAASKESHPRTAERLIYYFNSEQRVLSLTKELLDVSSTHVLNLHKPLKKKQLSNLKKLNEKVLKFLVSKDHKRTAEVDEEFDQSFREQIQGIIDHSYNFKNSLLYITYLNSLKDCVSLLIEQRNIIDDQRDMVS